MLAAEEPVTRKGDHQVPLKIQLDFLVCLQKFSGSPVPFRVRKGSVSSMPRVVQHGGNDPVLLSEMDLHIQISHLFGSERQGR
jgi:hypothetical protein